MKALALLLIAATNIHAQTTTPAPPSTANPSEMGIPCMADDECTPVVRSQSPPDPTGVPLCGCYSQSTIDGLLFDECEGSTDCKIARCVNSCEGYDAYCAVNEDGRGLCSLRTVDYVSPTVVGSTPTSLNTYTWVGICTSDEECNPKMREAVPGESEIIGVSTCECYANSNIDSLDECQGDVSCAMAMCLSDSCEGRTAYCSAEGTCQLDEEIDTSAVDGEEEGDLNPCMDGQCLSPAGVCETEVACFVDPCDIDNGGCEGDCEANYCGGCNAVCLDSVTSSSSTDGNVNVRPSEVTVTPVTQEPYTWEGPLCSTDNDCYSRNRERVPGESDVIGVTTCQCYANSFINPLDECQGERDMTCPIAGCKEDPCKNIKAYCLVETGMCYLEESTASTPAVTMPTITTGGSIDINTPTVSSPTATVTSPTENIDNDDYTWNPTCTTDDDCYPTMRTDEPGNSKPFGVAICECYANVFENPFNECQEDSVCISAMCLEYACEGITAFCSDQGLCELSVSDDDAAMHNTTNSIATIVTTSTASVTQGLATKPVLDTTSVTTSVAVEPINIDGTEPTKVENNTTEFVADGTSSSAATSTSNDPNVVDVTETPSTNASEVTSHGLSETEISSSSTIASETVEVEVSTDKQNETVAAAQPSQGRPEANETSEEIQLETSSTSTTTTEEIVVNITSDDNETLSNATTTENETSVSENNLSENAANEVDKSQEGIPLNSGTTLNVMCSFILGLAVANWLIQ